jgi:hypothetical protein
MVGHGRSLGSGGGRGRGCTFLDFDEGLGTISREDVTMGSGARLISVSRRVEMKVTRGAMTV